MDPRSQGQPGHRSRRADRLAAIIACSWPRAELTALAHRHSPDLPDALSGRLDACVTNLDRARVVAEALATQTKLDVTHSRNRPSDLAAIERMTRLLNDPRRELNGAVTTFKIAMRRLYRTRNIVLHGGSTRSVALNAALRIAAPLVGAGLDRMTHAALVEGLDPLDLAARAELALRLVGGETGLTPLDLLAPRSS